VIWILTAAALLAPSSMMLLSAQSAQHAGHGTATSQGGDRSPLVEAVRRGTARFRDVRSAIAAGYALFQGCVSGPEEGAMGVHYSNFALFDDQLDIDNPEVLVYEPRNGRLHLVAAEYVTPAEAWEPGRDPFDKPQLMGHLLHFAPGPNRYGPPAFYELHVWAWKSNPRGAFADWNPNVSCAEWDGNP
jgi:hypothetical protein